MVFNFEANTTEIVLILQTLMEVANDQKRSEADRLIATRLSVKLRSKVDEDFEAYRSNLCDELDRKRLKPNQKFIIKAINHSGRKGLRGTPVENEKYESLVGATIICNLKDAKQFKKFRWDFIDNPIYEYWTTSEVLGLHCDLRTDTWKLETANTIYELEEVLDE